jgi:hypothetical protein
MSWSPTTGRLVAAATILCAIAGSTSAQENHPVSLFGISLGSPFKGGKGYTFVREDQNVLQYILHNTTNPEYLIQGVEVSKLSHVIIKISGRAAHGPPNVCQRMVSETISQLTARYPNLTDRPVDLGGITATHVLSMERAGCSYDENVGRMSLQGIKCSSSFTLYCERGSNAFLIEASDTGYSNLARREAESLARSPARNHLD